MQETQEEYETPHIDIPVIQSFVVSKSAPYKDLYNPETNAERISPSQVVGTLSLLLMLTG